MALQTLNGTNAIAVSTTTGETPVAKLAYFLDWALKLGPIIGGMIFWAFSLNMNQAQSMKHSVDVDARISDMQKEMNEHNREMIERLAKSDAAVLELSHELKFYIDTQTTGRK